MTQTDSGPANTAPREANRVAQADSGDAFAAGRLGRLSRARLQAALDAFGLGALRAVHVPETGGYARTVLVSTQRGDFALRGFPRVGDALDGADGDPAKERAAAELLREHVPVPWPYLVASDPALLGFAFALLPRLPGLCLLDPAARRQLTGDDPQLVAAALGRSLASLHRVRRDQPLRWDAAHGAIVPDPRPHAERIAAEVQAKLARLRALDPAPPQADIDFCEQVLGTARPALAVPFPPTFVHRDFAPGNALVQRTAAGWRVSGVLDLSDWCFGDPEEDLPRSLLALTRIRPQLAARCLEAYTREHPLRPGFRERFPAYALNERLDVWLFARRSGRAQPASFRAWAEPSLQLLPTAQG